MQLAKLRKEKSLSRSHHISQDRTQRLERTNGILRQQTGRWHRQQNKSARNGNKQRRQHGW